MSRRSILYVPAIRDTAVAKARVVDCDCVILDLEDSIAPEMKDAARAKAIRAIAAGGWGHREVAIRVNGLNTEWSSRDFSAARDAGAAAIVVPKIQNSSDAVAAVASAGDIPVWAMIETPQSVVDACAIAETIGVQALLAGFADLAKDLRIEVDPPRTPLQYSMSAIIIAARIGGIEAFDGVYPEISNFDGLKAEACQAKMFGFDGKTIIHPSQIELVNTIFSPDAGKIAEAQSLILAYKIAQERGEGVTIHNGRLVEALHVAVAKRFLAAAARNANSAGMAQRGIGPAKQISATLRK